MGNGQRSELHTKDSSDGHEYRESSRLKAGRRSGLHSTEGSSSNVRADFYSQVQQTLARDGGLAASQGDTNAVRNSSWPLASRVARKRHATTLS